MSDNEKKDEIIEEPLVVKVTLDFLLDRAKIRTFNKEETLLYIIDTFIKNREQLLPLAEALRKEALGEPRLIIPSRNLKVH